MTYESRRLIVRAELIYTTDTGKWQERNWQTIPATLDAKARTASATLPEKVTVYYLNLIDDQNHTVSTAHEQLPLRPAEGQ